MSGILTDEVEGTATMVASDGTTAVMTGAGVGAGAVAETSAGVDGTAALSVPLPGDDNIAPGAADVVATESAIAVGLISAGVSINGAARVGALAPIHLSLSVQVQ